MKFQILIPTYNRGETLQRNLNYLLSEIKNHQLQSDIGIIVSDNASTDGTFAILENLLPSFKKEGIDYNISGYRKLNHIILLCHRSMY